MREVIIKLHCEGELKLLGIGSRRFAAMEHRNLMDHLTVAWFTQICCHKPA